MGRTVANAVGFLTGTENLQNFEWLVIAEVLDKVAHVARHDADIASHVVECACVTFRGENGDSGTTLDEERPVPSMSVYDITQQVLLAIPFISIWVPVHLAHGARLNIQVAGGDRFGDGEVLAVHNARLAAATFVRWGVEHVVGVLVLRLLECRRFLLVDALRDRA